MISKIIKIYNKRLLIKLNNNNNKFKINNNKINPFVNKMINMKKNQKIILKNLSLINQNLILKQISQLVN